MDSNARPSNPPDPAVPRTITGFLRVTFRRIVSQRKWMLLPLWVLLAVVAILLVLSGGSSLLPVIYLAF